MITICLRSDNPQAELRLYSKEECIAQEEWQAHRLLAETVHKKIRDLLRSNGLTYEDIGKVVVYEGPGSFTGLRIGISVANAIGYGLNVPVVAGRGELWAEEGVSEYGSFTPIPPVYGQEPHITRQKK